MGKLLTEINGINVFEYEYEQWKGKENVNSLTAEGMCFRFANWLRENDIADDTAEDVYNNTSGIRDGNRLDIHDNYQWEELEIIFLYTVNGTVWAVLYNPEDDSYYGEVEIS